MDNDWAALHLQTIRTLMERSALYRRAIAPISIFVGVMGILAGIAGWEFRIESGNDLGADVTLSVYTNDVFNSRFAFYWMAVSVVTVIGALLLTRRQALKQGENFWSPPTRRVVQAMFPPLLVGLALGSLFLHVFRQFGRLPMFDLVVFWTLLYGLGLHAAGFFMPRGIRLFGWGFIIAGLSLMVLLCCDQFSVTNFSPHLAMGILFGASHLAYGVYLYFTERKNET